MRLDTKEKRMENRKFYYDEGAQVIDMPEIQLQAFTADNPRGKENYFTLTVFTGTAGKPNIHYSYRTKERRDSELQKAIDSQKRRMEYKAQRKEENKGKLTGAAATAAAIKTRLKKEFPGVKFSVRSDNFSMGNSVDIEWTDGPMSEDVKAITGQYQYGRFDGMQDLAYNVKINEEGLGCPGAKYVHASRRLSDEYRAQIKEVLEQNFAPYHGGNYGNDNYAPFQWTEAEKILLEVSLEEDQGQEQEPEGLPEAKQKQEPQQQKPVTRKEKYALDCGCTVATKKEIHACRDCGGQFCGKHIYTYVDDSNVAITRNSPELCAECYAKRYSPGRVQQRQQKPSTASNVIDITARLKAKQEQREAEEAIRAFETDYLPFLRPDDLELLLSGPAVEHGENLIKICMRIDMERRRSGH